MPAIDPNRLLADLTTLRSFGAYKTGVHRPTFSPQDVAARQWLTERMTDAGLEPTIDGIGNVFGKSKVSGRKALSGSHLESQNYAGWLDGALGVIYALEAARALRDDASTADLGVDVVAFCDEEGHFGSLLGSRSMIGDVTEEEIDKARDRTHGKPMRGALQEAGYAGRPRLLLDPSRYVGFFEAHIEQGGSLEADGLKLGIVTAIVGIWNYRITATGQQNHAGSTMMKERRDAGVALIRLLNAIDKRIPQVAGPRSVWTTGRITLDPGAPNIIPGEAQAVFQFRDADPDVLERLDATLQELVAEENRTSRCPIKVETVSRSTPAVMDARLQQALEDAAKAAAPGLSVRMPSGAGHDSQIVARRMPAAMLFVPSIGGISHHWAESTSDEDIVLGSQVLADAIARVLRN